MESATDVEEYDLNYHEEFYDTAVEIADTESSRHIQEDLDCETLPKEEVENILKAEAEALSDIIKVAPDLARDQLQGCDWRRKLAVEVYKIAKGLVVDDHTTLEPPDTASSPETCLLCKQSAQNHMIGPVCGHQFCTGCWKIYCRNQIQGAVSGISCMVEGCTALVTEKFVCSTGVSDELLKTYQNIRFNDSISRHCQMQFCPGENCNMIIRARVPQAKRVTCHQCGTSFCFQCRLEYHAPASCETMKRWLTESAYHMDAIIYYKAGIAAHPTSLDMNTKNCPDCEGRMWKASGCNRIHCISCSSDFCWICLKDWKTHVGDFYNCNQYDASLKQSQLAPSFDEYSFDYYRWECHAASRKLEETAAAAEHNSLRLEERTNSGASGIDWQLLSSAMACLKKCRHTLQYTYPYAYYMEEPQKRLFKFQQGKFEAEVENLAWSIEDVNLKRNQEELQKRMKIAEKWREVMLTESAKNAPASCQT